MPRFDLKGMNKRSTEQIEVPPHFSYTVPSSSDRRVKDETAKKNLIRQLVDTGEKDRIKQKLRSRLADCGWRDEMKELAKDAIRSRGLEKVTVDELVSELLPRGRATVPEKVKTDLLTDMRDFVRRHDPPAK
mmetsp:Transcript_56768/g.66371  ORF Transcript_56768/g.66371 Transcript_56768/m.66371 type:complete len:132 (-) Transcript_56768:19-414(-)|eukprot:CAMPEP_0171310194 /NCGR_PEP_ID=MMETSP0816-20121228/20422_1 /TAXON_ID=420281 /ORGANISM="Proboscia inermis, Strain CCAP1064/1" /LENGTH=131 /DNA_ID=CAMNT_0011794213 /DNA_START=72 /DNA_END=467 /DNA_ORIENTATION=+